ncbi:MAG TPA: hypothetical protein VKA47_09040 [Solirubrobacterales bacterium]|nr:hypothetical protein [Solirubrobacterales bacterium]
MERIRSHLTYANVMATIAVFLVLSGGTAVALTGTNTVFTDDIVNDQVKSADVRNDDLAKGGLGALDLRAGSVRGSEVLESTLDQVPSALLGGLGRWTGGGSCEPPENGVFVNCALVTVNLPAPARLLLMGQATGSSEGGPEGVREVPDRLDQRAVLAVHDLPLRGPSGDHLSGCRQRGVPARPALVRHRLQPG